MPFPFSSKSSNRPIYVSHPFLLRLLHLDPSRGLFNIHMPWSGRCLVSSSVNLSLCSRSGETPLPSWIGSRVLIESSIIVELKKNLNMIDHILNNNFYSNTFILNNYFFHPINKELCNIKLQQIGLIFLSYVYYKRTSLHNGKFLKYPFAFPPLSAQCATPQRRRPYAKCYSTASTTPRATVSIIHRYSHDRHVPTDSDRRQKSNTRTHKEN